MLTEFFKDIHGSIASPSYGTIALAKATHPESDDMHVRAEHLSWQEEDYTITFFDLVIAFVAFIFFLFVNIYY